MKCDRCGRIINRGWIRQHNRTCRLLPKPNDLLDEYKQGGGSYDELGRKYGVSRYAIHLHLEKATPDGVRPSDIKRDYLRQQKGKKRQIINPFPNRHRPRQKGGQCERCWIILDHPLVPEGGYASWTNGKRDVNGRVCGFCLDEVKSGHDDVDHDD